VRRRAQAKFAGIASVIDIEYSSYLRQMYPGAQTGTRAGRTMTLNCLTSDQAVLRPATLIFNFQRREP
jgi:hypothetical protein